MRLIFHPWSSTLPRGRQRTGVLCLDEETGVAVVVFEHRSQMKNQQIAEERVKLILEKVVTW